MNEMKLDKLFFNIPFILLFESLSERKWNESERKFIPPYSLKVKTSYFHSSQNYVGLLQLCHRFQNNFLI